MYMSATKMDMKSSAIPKSFMKTSMASDSTHMTSSGPKYLNAGTGTPSTCRCGTDEHDLLVVQVAGQEDDDRQLGELGRLDAEAERVDPELGAVDRRARRRW